ncbi:MAG: RpiB/LacA/LacB family sugar-phosphate isomerase [Candidatus Kaiserbacteria bacterium]|nr:RpiB/LacA/LacB family sugar-phosphate isomerase [Candidatus Kaiserbacteria bacterium]
MFKDDMTIILSADHAGFEMKEHIKSFLEDEGYKRIEDVGATQFYPTDHYPRYMKDAADRLTKTPNAFGILFGGSGQGEAIVANRYKGVRAIVYPAHNTEIVLLGRQHNDANVLSIGARLVSNSEAEEAIRLFLTTPFSYEDRHERRVQQIDEG